MWHLNEWRGILFEKEVVAKGLKESDMHIRVNQKNLLQGFVFFFKITSFTHFYVNDMVKRNSHMLHL